MYNKRIATSDASVSMKNGIAGITIVALVITIIVMLILSGITINGLWGDNGLIKKAQEAANKYENVTEQEETQRNEIQSELDQIGKPWGNIEITSKPTTSTNTTQVGEQNGIPTGPIEVTICFNKEKGLQKEYATQLIGEETQNIVWKSVTNNLVTFDTLKNMTIFTRYKNIEQSTSETITYNVMCVDTIKPDNFTYEIINKDTNSITIYAQANDTADLGAGYGIAGIAKYQFSKDNGITWEEDENNFANTRYTFSNLQQNQKYTIAVKAIDKAGNETSASNNGTVIITGEIISGNDETNPYFPDDSFSKLPGTDLDTGLVVTDGTNEYVWVEVPKSITASATTTAQIETALQNYSSAYKYSQTLDTWYNGCGIATAAEYNALKDKTLNSIKNYGGFWLGRYEMGTADDNLRVRNGPITINAVSAQDRYVYNYITSAQAYELANRNSTTNYTCSIPFTLQWQLICKFIETKGVSEHTIKRDSTSIGNYLNTEFSIYRGKYTDNNDGYTQWKIVEGSYSKPFRSYVVMSTGASERNKVANIYDIAGNEREITLGSSSGYGGSYAGYGDLYDSGNIAYNSLAGGYGYKVTEAYCTSRFTLCK